MRTAAIVANPSKIDDPASVRRQLTAELDRAGWAEPLWLETTVEDSGTGQTQQALRAGVDLVCALGGDGTVRCVADRLIGRPTPLAILSAGTGNLLARNLRVRHKSYAASLRTALHGRTQVIDSMQIALDRDGDGSACE